ncbi:MAG: PD-(D/E)XK nuclease family protein [Crocinitomicaceae bacterium]
MTEDLKEIQKLIDDFEELKIKERNGSTFLEIAKCPHLENVWSNILAFYLNPNNEHNLHELLIKSIFQSIDTNISLTNLKGITVWTEYRTTKGNRIDIVVIATNFILGIENKVGAGLYNDLADYSATIDELAKIQSLPTYKIVLSKYRNNTTNDFINLIYPDLIKVIRQNIGSYSDYSDTKYLIFFLDFLKNIENNINSNSMGDNLEVISFLQKNVVKVNKLIEYHNKFNFEFVGKLDNIDKNINRDEIKLELEKLNKSTGLIGSASNKTTGRFTWQGSQLIKYNIKIGDISLFYQVGFSDYIVHSHYWFADTKYQPIELKLKEKGVDYTNYEYNETDEEIAEKVTQQIKVIINELDKQT